MAPRAVGSAFSTLPLPILALRVAIPALVLRIIKVVLHSRGRGEMMRAEQAPASGAEPARRGGDLGPAALASKGTNGLDHRRSPRVGNSLIELIRDFGGAFCQASTKLELAGA